MSEPSQNTTDNNSAKQKPEKQSFLLNIVLNIALPTFILMKLSGEDMLGPVWSIVVALSFPIGYGLWDYSKSHKPNLYSALGVISVTLTGGISLLQLDPQYIAIKEAAIPACFGIATLISLKTPYPLVKTFLFNDQILQIAKVNTALKQHNNTDAFENKLRNASFMVAGSFFLSSALNLRPGKIYSGQRTRHRGIHRRTRQDDGAELPCYCPTQHSGIIGCPFLPTSANSKAHSPETRRHI